MWEHSGLVEERIYLGGWEVYRKRDSLGNLLLERETLHGMDGTRRILLVETKTVDVDAIGVFTPVSRMRFQLDNHLGSASLEVDESGLVIGYEEYHPYGTTAYALGRSGAEVSGKRYRYTGKERDDETGLYYHGARYLAPWLGRWMSSDPAGLADGLNTYGYVHDSPVVYFDPTGHQKRHHGSGPSLVQIVGSVNESVKRVEHKLIMTFLDATYREKQVEDHKQIAAGVGDAVHEVAKSVGQLRDHPDEIVLAKAAEVIQAYNDAGGGVVGLGRGANRINPLLLGAEALSKSTVGMIDAAQRGDPRSFGRNATPLALFLGTLNQAGSASVGSGPLAVSTNVPHVAAAQVGTAGVAAGSSSLVAAAGILLSSTNSSSGNPASSAREGRLNELSKDPANGNRSTPKSKREAEVGLSLEEDGKLHGLKRDPTGAAEFIDADGISWDVKGFVSGDMKGGFKLAEAAMKIEREFSVGENVIVDTAKMTAQDISALKAEAVAKAWGEKVIFHPQQ